MRKKIWVNRAKSFKESEKFDAEYYFSMTPKERLETMQLLRQMYGKIKRGQKNESGKRLRRVIRVIQQA